MRLTPLDAAPERPGAAFAGFGVLIIRRTAATRSALRPSISPISSGVGTGLPMMWAVMQIFYRWLASRGSPVLPQSNEAVSRTLRVFLAAGADGGVNDLLALRPTVELQTRVLAAGMGVAARGAGRLPDFNRLRQPSPDSFRRRRGGRQGERLHLHDGTGGGAAFRKRPGGDPVANCLRLW